MQGGKCYIIGCGGVDSDIREIGIQKRLVTGIEAVVVTLSNAMWIVEFTFEEKRLNVKNCVGG